MQGPRRKPGPPATGLRRWVGKWRPRIVLLTVIFGIAAAAHIAALPVAALLGLAAMIWIAEGHRSQALPVVLVASVGGLVLVFACYGFSPDAFSYVFRSSSGFLWFSIDPARRFFSTLSNGGVTLAACASIVLYLAARKSRYFGNTVPLLCGRLPHASRHDRRSRNSLAVVLPFLLTFIGGVFADAYEGPRGKLALVAGGAIVLAQAVLCLLSLPGMT